MLVQLSRTTGIRLQCVLSILASLPLPLVPRRSTPWPMKFLNKQSHNRRPQPRRCAKLALVLAHQNDFPMKNFLDLPNMVTARSAPTRFPLLRIRSRFFGQVRCLSTAVTHNTTRTPVNRATVRQRPLVPIRRTTIPFGNRVASNALGGSFPASCRRSTPTVLTPLGSTFSQ